MDACGIYDLFHSSFSVDRQRGLDALFAIFAHEASKPLTKKAPPFILKLPNKLVTKSLACANSFREVGPLFASSGEDFEQLSGCEYERSLLTICRKSDISCYI
jgi:hypothetical protein